MKLAFIIGHCPAKPGAKLYNGQTEFSYHLNLLGRYLVPRLETMATQYDIFWRPGNKNYRAAISSLAKRVNEWNPDMAIELHINALNGRDKIRGHEFLYNHSVSQSYGLRYSDALQALGIRRRRSVQAISGTRGAYNLLSLKCPGILLEPCFGDTENEDSIEIVGKPEQYAEILAETLWEWEYE